MVRRAGLSISTVKASEIEFPTRIEAEYYQPYYLANKNTILNCGLPVKRLKEIATKITDGSHITPEYQEDGVKFVMVRNLHEHNIDFEDVKYITPEMDKFLKQCKPARGDILLSKVGSIGVSAVVPNDAPDFNIFVSLAVIKGVSPKLQTYVSTFLNSRFGRLQAERVAKGISQPDLHLEDIREFIIPIPSDKFADKISSIILKAESLRKQSEHLYADAENLLASELGLDKLDLSESVFSIKNVSDVQNTKRIDAEHYKPKYQRLFEHLRKTGQAVKLADWVKEPLKRGVQPEYVDDGDVKVINSQHVSKTQIELEDNRTTTKEFCQAGSNKRATIKQYDVLLNSTGYITIGRSQTLLEKIDAMVDGHVTIIRPKDDLDPVYLGVYLNSLPGLLQTERGWTGSSGQIELRIEIVENFLVWKPSMKIQLKIRQMIEQSYQARQEAKRLLAEAKSAVEKMIEGI